MSPPPPEPVADFFTHAVKWDRETVARFWSGWSEAMSASSYFGGATGAAVIRFAERHARLTPGRILDVGAGQGHLMEYLAGAGYRVWGVDGSAATVDAARTRLRGVAGVEQVDVAPVSDLPFPDGAFDAVVSLEVVEHLLTGDIEPYFSEISRVLRPGGILVLSTPNREDLDAGRALCPDCGAVFHRMQHLQSWDPIQLQKAASAGGLDCVKVAETTVAQDRRRAMAAWARRVGTWVARVPHTRPNLILLARKSPG